MLKLLKILGLSQMAKDYLFKIIITGDGAVGKTSIRNYMVGKNFETQYMMTIGADFAVKEVKIGDKNVKLQIWDVAGQERMMSVRAVFYKGARGVLMVFDLARPYTLDNLNAWYNTVNEYLNPTDVTILLLGNKLDVVDDHREVTAKAKAFAQKIGATYFETSAKTGTGIIETEKTLVNRLLDKFLGEEISEEDPKQKDSKESTKIELRTTVAPYLFQKDVEPIFELK